MARQKTRKDLHRHFQKRWWGRVDPESSPPIDEIERTIMDGGSETIRFSWRQSNARTHWAVDWDGKTYTAVYDKRRGAVVTVLPPASDGKG
jgi:hypothetical protein